MAILLDCFIIKTNLRFIYVVFVASELFYYVQ